MAVRAPLATSRAALLAPHGCPALLGWATVEPTVAVQAARPYPWRNIQSLNAAYATSGPMYLSDYEGVGSTATYPKGTMTLGRAASRAMYSGRVTAMGSTPNIATVGNPHADLLSYGDLGSLSMLHHQGTPSALLRQAVRGSGGELLEFQAQLRDMQRENELLRRELDLKDSKLGSSTNSIKSFWSPELKKRTRDEERGGSSHVNPQRTHASDPRGESG